MREVSFAIGADIAPVPSTYAAFASGSADALVDAPIQTVLNRCDFRMFNLEAPLADTEQPIKKCGPNLIAPTAAVKGIAALCPSLLGISNNHILDQGEQGLFSTLQTLDQAGIAHIGAGAAKEQAASPCIFSKNGLKIGVYACVEHEFSLVTERRAGANPFDPFESPDHVAALKAQCDFVIVLYHGGRECYRYPSPHLQKVCRFLADKGADLVVCQHTHCVGAMERYNGAAIVYGQGNFHFGHREDNEFWQTSLLLEARFGETVELSFHPIYSSKDGTRYAKGAAAEAILSGFDARSKEILQPGFIEQAFLDEALKNKGWYLFALAGGKEKAGQFDRAFGSDYAQNVYLQMVNYLHCEPHLEVLQTAVTALAGLNAQ